MNRIDPKTFGRKQHRHKLFEPATIALSGATRRAHLLNLSMTGALVHCGDPPQIGQWITIDCGALRVDAEMLWIDKEKRFGVRFREPVPQDIIDALIGPRTAGQ